MTKLKKSPIARPKLDLSFEQETAISMCTDVVQRIVGVTGGAGTGKTVVLGAAVEECLRLGYSVALCAPTGRAAKRIEELTGYPAKTIHRLLEFPDPGEEPDDDDYELPPNEPKRCRMFPLDERIVFVDESSMVGPVLYGQLMDALGPKSCVRFFGDNNQLPPVENDPNEKPPFFEILKSKPSITLSFNYRSGDDILENANRIIKGSIPRKNSRFNILYTESPMRYMLDFVKDAQEFANDTHQIITPTRVGKYGCTVINPSLQVRFNPNGDMLQLERYGKNDADLVVRGADKFLWIKNDYKLKLFNGDIGRIDWLDPDEGSLHLSTAYGSYTVPPRLRTYSHYHGRTIEYDPRKQIELGYAITTHKSQGSEFDTIIYCMSRGQAGMLNRRNFYTAITRAKTHVIVICDNRSMSLSMRKESL